MLPESGLISLMGGKWTAYRVQGEETTDRIFKEHPVLFQKAKNQQGMTLKFNLIGSYSKVEITDELKREFAQTA